jgi:hypothetical protein
MAAPYLGIGEYVRPAPSFDGPESVGRGRRPVPVQEAVRTVLDLVGHAQRVQGWEAAFLLLSVQCGLLVDRYGDDAVKQAAAGRCA